MFNVPDDWRGWVWPGGNTPHDLQDRYLTTEPLAPGTVLVQNAAIGLNPVDWKVLDSQIGKVPGVDGAGTVVAIGPEVEPRWLGARVAYHQSLQRPGSFAEFTPIAAQVLMRIPDAIDFATAAALPVLAVPSDIFWCNWHRLAALM